MMEEYTSKNNYGIYRRRGNNMKRDTEETTEVKRMRTVKQRRYNENKGI